MINMEEIYNELQRIDGQAAESACRIRRIGELARDSMNRVNADFSDQQEGGTLINALSLIQVSCDFAANSISQVPVAAHDIISKLKQ